MDARVAHPDQLAYVRESRVTGGPAHGARAIDVAPYGGVHVRVLPDRGLDLGRASWRGVPLSWTSGVGECGPLQLSGEETWMDGFGGGLLTTCGLRNVGLASEGFGLHGVISHQRASDVGVTRRTLDGGRLEVEIAGRVEEASAVDGRLVLDRRVRVRSGEGVLAVEDVTTNEGARPEPAPILYHVNFGFPFVEEGVCVEIAAEATLERDGQAVGGRGWGRIGPPDPEASPVVLEHVVSADSDGIARARVTNARLGIELELSWRSDGLPRLHQWVQLTPHAYVLALEPANCSLMGRALDRAAGRLPLLEPGERRTTAVWLRVRG